MKSESNKWSIILHHTLGDKKCRSSLSEHPCRSVISISLRSNFTEISHRHWCSAVNVLHIFRTHFSKNISGGMLLQVKKNGTWLRNNDRNSRVSIFFLNCFSLLINSLSHSLCYYSRKDWICNFELSLLTGSAEVSLLVQNSQHIQVVYFICFELRFLQ